MFFLSLAIFIVSRLIKLKSFLPLFIDEALYIRWLTEIQATNNWLIPLKEFGWEPLNIWLATLINFIASDPLISLRQTAAIFGLLTFIVLYQLLKHLTNQKTAIFASIIYALSPIILLHDRLGLRGDSTISFACVLALLGLYQRLVKKRKKFSFLIAFAIIMGFFTKTTAISIPIIVFLAFFIYKTKPKLIDFKALLLTTLPFLFYLATNTLLLVITKSTVFASSHNLLLQTKNNLIQILLWFNQYLTWPVILLFVIGIFISFKKHQDLFKLFGLSLIIPLILALFTSKILFPRYVLLSYLSILVFSGAGFALLINHVPKILKPLSVVLFVPSLIISFQIIFNIQSAQLPEIEKWQYISGWPSGYGLKELADYIKINPPDVLIVEENNLIRGGLPYYFKDHQLEIVVLNQDNTTDFKPNPDQITYLALNVLESPPDQFQSELIKEFSRPENKSALKLYKIVNQ